ncbi:hypothetical protein [Dongia sedimenti]|uniref:Transposase n=1 Tax=Dongia sedimenti TaxID=3064282 RepID=A0ABU0YG58_9PROT|nr:hypothetical protein [Rhodospirillaceae bacterium R-7]
MAKLTKRATRALKKLEAEFDRRFDRAFRDPRAFRKKVDAVFRANGKAKKRPVAGDSY